MNMHRWQILRHVVFAAALVLLSAASRGTALPPAPRDGEAVQLAQLPDATPRELEPRYTPVPPEPKSWYNDAYLFGMTRGVAQSTLVPGVKAPLFLLTVPLDIVLLPFTAIAGCFG
jgi:hypothetical protein